MSAVSYDTLTIEIGANVKGASQGIKTLKNNLNALQKVVSNLDTTTLSKVEKHLQKIANIDFSNVSKGLQDVVSAFKYLQTISSGKKDFTNFTFSMDAQAIDVASDYSVGSEPKLPKLNYDASYLSNLQQGIQYFTKTEDEMKKVYITANKCASVMKKFANAIGSHFQKQLKGFGDKLGRIASAFKRILFYRVVRRMIQLVGQAIKEGIQNMALFDADFNKSMSNIMNSVNYLKNALGTMIAPIVEVLEPVITTLVDGLGDIANSVGELLNASLGKNTFSSAIKGAEDYAESLKKAKAVSLGIDELNIVKQDEKQNFETKDITNPQEEPNGLVKFANHLKELLTTILQGLKSILEPFLSILDKVLGLVGVVLGAVAKIIEPILKIVKSLLVLVDSLLGVLLPILETVVNVVADLLTPILNMIAVYIETIVQFLKPFIDLSASIIRLVMNLISNALQPIITIAQAYSRIQEKIFNILQPIYDVLNKVFNFFSKGLGNMTGGNGSIKDRWADGYQFGDIIGTSLDLAKKPIEWVKGLLGFASGGFPEDGFFFANHNELVGQFSNGKTAVVNNEQITEGIYQAVRNAMQDANSDNYGKEIVLQIDGREIGRASEKYQAQQGAKKIIFSGGGN